MLNMEGFVANDNAASEIALNAAISRSFGRSLAFVKLSPDEAREFGLNGMLISLDRLLYLLSGNVVEQDREMAQVANRFVDRWCEEAT